VRRPTFIGPLILLAMLARVSRGDGPAAPAMIVAASIASTQKASAAAKEMGLGEIPFISAQFIEEQMPFIGPGGLASDRPLGVLFYAGGDVDLERSATFVFPVNPGKAELKTFIDRGAQPVAGRTDVVKLEAFAFRRAKDQFIFGQVEGAVAAVREDVLTSAYGAADAKDALARVDVDVAAIKNTLPEKYEAFFTDVVAGVDKKEPGAQAGADFVVKLMRGITRLRLAASRAGEGDAAGLKLAVLVEPFAVSKGGLAKNYIRPGLPRGTLARADIAMPPADAFSRVTDVLVDVIGKDAGFAKLTAKQQEQAEALAASVAKVLLSGDAASLGVERVKDRVFVVDWVSRRAAPPDVEAEMKDVVAQGAEFSRRMNETGSPFEYRTYTAPGGVKVHRLVMKEAGRPSLIADAVAGPGNVVRMTFSTEEGTFVERLLSLKDEGEATSPISGWVDPAAMLEFAGVVDPMKVHDLKDAIRGRRVQWSGTPETNAVRIEISAPKQLLQNLPKIVPLVQ
jgi:hypothetical protein